MAIANTSKCIIMERNKKKSFLIFLSKFFIYFNSIKCIISKGKEIKHHTENIRVRDLTKKSEDSSDNKTINSKEEKIYKPGTPRDRY